MSLTPGEGDVAFAVGGVESPTDAPSLAPAPAANGKRDATRLGRDKEVARRNTRTRKCTAGEGQDAVAPLCR
jgi:hypothetical protein